MDREIRLDGGEISLLKKIGLSGTPIHGKMLVDRVGELEAVEFLDTLTGLIDRDYVVSDKVNLRLMEDVEKASFRVNDLMKQHEPAARRQSLSSATRHLRQRLQVRVCRRLERQSLARFA